MNEMTKDPVSLYSWYGVSLFADCGEGVRLRESRDHLHSLNKDDDQEVRSIDEIVIEAAIANEYVTPDLINDNASVPLQSWWWHLGKIRAKTYPAELLPAPLQAVYAETEK
jgi:hypothetical protein